MMDEDLARLIESHWLLSALAFENVCFDCPGPLVSEYQI